MLEDDWNAELCRPIAPSIMQRINQAALNFNIKDVPKDLQLLPDDMMDWLEKENDAVPPPAKKAKAKGVLLESRFGNRVTTEKERAECSKGFVPKATRDNTKWAVRNFQEWQEWRNTQTLHSDDLVPEDLLEGRDAEGLSKWLSFYVKET